MSFGTGSINFVKNYNKSVLKDEVLQPSPSLMYVIGLGEFSRLSITQAKRPLCISADEKNYFLEPRKELGPSNVVTTKLARFPRFVVDMSSPVSFQVKISKILLNKNLFTTTKNESNTVLHAENWRSVNGSRRRTVNRLGHSQGRNSGQGFIGIGQAPGLRTFSMADARSLVSRFSSNWNFFITTKNKTKTVLHAENWRSVNASRGRSVNRLGHSRGRNSEQGFIGIGQAPGLRTFFL